MILLNVCSQLNLKKLSRNCQIYETFNHDNTSMLFAKYNQSFITTNIRVSLNAPNVHSASFNFQKCPNSDNSPYINYIYPVQFTIEAFTRFYNIHIIRSISTNQEIPYFQNKSPAIFCTFGANPVCPFRLVDSDIYSGTTSVFFVTSDSYHFTEFD